MVKTTWTHILQRFERFANTAKWHKTGWASKLSALLSGRALEMYSCLSEEVARDYNRVKIALMKRYMYDLTEDGYCRKFRASKLAVDESPDQFIVLLDRYLLRWLELSDTKQTFQGLKDLIVKEQFIDSCPKDLAIEDNLTDDRSILSAQSRGITRDIGLPPLLALLINFSFLVEI